jgi:DnaJ-class molecular chaperone
LISVLLVLLLIAVAIALLMVLRRRRGLEHSDYEAMQEIMSGFGITRSPREINCYDILDVKRNASVTDIRKAYRDKAAIHHPDRSAMSGGGDDQTIREINAAKTILLDREKREVHDRMLNHFRPR